MNLIVGLLTAAYYCGDLSRGGNQATTWGAAIASEGRFERSKNLIAKRAARRAGAMPAIARSVFLFRAPRPERERHCNKHCPAGWGGRLSGLTPIVRGGGGP
ncbi:hypothetical protein GCM10010177_68380 [Actinomadura citrea]|nr:hypothetical protein GCM10010177_68380 [Actinomadura citrea]